MMLLLCPSWASCKRSIHPVSGVSCLLACTYGHGTLQFQSTEEIGKKDREFDEQEKTGKTHGEIGAPKSSDFSNC
jgi:hypothetical protein